MMQTLIRLFAAAPLIVLATADTAMAESDDSLLATHEASAREALASKNYGEAADWFRKAAHQGSTEAQFYLGLLYEAGRGVPFDEALAATWYRKAAEGGSAEAQYNLAALYARGAGVPQDYNEAIKWLRKAAGAGIAGLGSTPAVTAKDREQPAATASPPAEDKQLQERLRKAKLSPQQRAAELQKAAQQGDPEAQYKLGEMYESGKGVPQDGVLAEQWKRIAISHGYKPTP